MTSKTTIGEPVHGFGEPDVVIDRTKVINHYGDEVLKVYSVE